MKTMREALYERAGGRCEQCGAVGDRSNWELHTHHLVYSADEKLEDFIVLCLTCHGRAHPRHNFLTKSQQNQRRKKRDSQRGWDVKAARRALEKAARRIDRRYS